MLRGLVKSGLSVTLLRALNVCLSFAVLLLLTRLLDPEGLGYYAYWTTLLMLVGVPISNGWAPLLLRESSRALVGRKWSGVNGILRRGGQFAIGYTLFIFAAGLVILWSLHTDQSGWINLGVLIPISVILLFDQLSALRTALLRGLGGAVVGQLPEMLVKPAAQLVLFALMIAAGVNASAQSALAVLACATAATYLAGALILRRRKPADLTKAAPSYEDASWIRSAAVFTGGAAIMLVNANVDLILLGLLRNTAEVGIYKVALQVSLVGALAYTSLNMIAVQQFTTLHASGSILELQRTATHLARLALLPALATFFLLLVAGHHIMPIVFGSDFAPALMPLLILAAAQTINAGFGMGRSLLMMTGREANVLIWSAIGLAANVILCGLLIPRFGANGAAIANAASLAIWNVGVWWTVWCKLSLDVSALGAKG